MFHSGRGCLAWDIRRDRAVGRSFGLRDRGDVEGELGPDGRTFVIRLRARDRALVQVWDVPRHRLLARPEAAVSDRGLLPALTPDGRSLLTCLPGGETLEVRTLADGRGRRVTWPRQVRRQACRAGKWTVTPDSRALAFDTPDGIRPWELSPARERPRLDLPGHGEWEADFSADGATAVTTGDGVIALWRTSRPGTPLMRYAVEGDAVDARLDMKDGVVRYLVGGVVRSLDVRDALRGDRLREPLERAAFSQDGRSLAAAQRRGGTTVFQLRDARDGAVTSSLSGRTCAQCRPGLFAFSRDGGTLAYTAESDGGTELRQWSVDRRRETARAVIPSYVASLLVPDGGGPVVTSGTPAGNRDNDRHYVDAWSVGERTRTRQLHRRAGDEPSALSPNGRTVLARNGERIAIGSGESTRVLRSEISITAVAFSPDGRHLAVAGGNGRLTLWNASGTRRLGVLAESAAGPGTGATPVLAFSPDGRHLAVGREDGTVRLWETDTPRLSGATYPGAEGPVLALGFTRDELRVTTPRTPVRALPLSPERAADRACERAGGGLDRDEWRTYLPTLEYRRTC
ncbi:WD40 repeat domain-containing protein [Streptomyces alboflavus]|uniref:WD40 repeat domain-containing protein n=1 Tax=Streptomyces alboflavus TaxID=67267 RepID=UPI00367720D7